MVLLKMKQRPDADRARSMIFPESQSIDVVTLTTNLPGNDSKF